MSWYQFVNDKNHMVISSRVRLARNCSHFPFPAQMTPQQSAEVIQKIREILVPKGFEEIDFQKVSPLQAAAYVEQRYVSPEFTQIKGNHALYLNEPCNLSVMACEEDHIRIQCIEPGLALEKAFSNAVSVEEMLDEGMQIASTLSLYLI